MPSCVTVVCAAIVRGSSATVRDSRCFFIRFVIYLDQYVKSVSVCFGMGGWSLPSGWEYKLSGYEANILIVVRYRSNFLGCFHKGKYKNYPPIY